MAPGRARLELGCRPWVFSARLPDTGHLVPLCVSPELLALLLVPPDIGPELLALLLVPPGIVAGASRQKDTVWDLAGLAKREPLHHPLLNRQTFMRLPRGLYKN